MMIEKPDSCIQLTFCLNNINEIKYFSNFDHVRRDNVQNQTQNKYDRSDHKDMFLHFISFKLKYTNLSFYFYFIVVKY